jgi:hypothetical protein
MSVEEVANKYRLPDLHGAIVDYLLQPNNDVLGSRRQVSNNSSPLPISLLRHLRFGQKLAFKIMLTIPHMISSLPRL